MGDTARSAFDAEYIAALPYETPYFLFSEAKLLARIREFNRHLPNVSIQYALKANSDPAVLRIIADAGCGFEAASRYELRLLQNIDVPPDKIIYGTSVKSAAHIREFAEYGVECFACDSRTELEKIAANAPGSCIYVRLVVNDAGSVFKFSEKFGTDRTTAVSLLGMAASLGLRPHGLSFHVGSQSRNHRAWANALANVREAMIALSQARVELEMLNLGGGFPCQYASTDSVPTLAEIGGEILEQYRQLPYQPRLIAEPGRGIVAEAGVLVASVIARIPRRETTWLFLDAGVYNGLFEAMAYQGSTRYVVAAARPSNASGEALFALAGPTGDSPDVITREALLPADMDVGDKVIVRNAGAYSLSVTSEFNGFPKPAAYLV
ncbi:MAG TPA: type III PLP-dependent enzyme [Rhizomicrobium sp.]